jgi:uncharacterized protein YndB with AHSA1/START domain
MTGKIATAQVHVDARIDRVWRALTDPAEVREWMFGTTLETDWRPGSPITWSGEYEGRSYQDKGEVIEVDEPRTLTVTHFSPLSGLPDEPSNYHTVSYVLTDERERTRLAITQDNNTTHDEVEHSRANWQQALKALKAHVEAG